MIDILPDETGFLEGDSILLEGYGSSANCGYITAYRWRLDGVTVSTSGEYIPSLSLPAGQSSQTCDVQLRVRNSVGKYGYKTVKITIARSLKYERFTRAIVKTTERQSSNARAQLPYQW